MEASSWNHWGPLVTMEAHSGAMESQSGALEPHFAAMEANTGAMGFTLEPERPTLQSLKLTLELWKLTWELWRFTPWRLHVNWVYKERSKLEYLYELYKLFTIISKLCTDLAHSGVPHLVDEQSHSVCARKNNPIGSQTIKFERLWHLKRDRIQKKPKLFKMGPMSTRSNLNF
jgi:hypothetical protein